MVEFRKQQVPVALLGLTVLFMPSSARAEIKFLSSDELGVNVFQQKDDHPCVIGDQSCKEPPGMVYTARSGTPGPNNSTYDLYSPVYLASPAASFSSNQIPLMFSIGLDVNHAAKDEFLVAFRMYRCGSGSSVGGTAEGGSQTTSAPSNCVSPTLSAPNSYSPTSPTQIPDNHNGNGFSDAVLTGFSVSPGVFYVFEAIVSNDTAGMEEFFLLPSSVPALAPEPASILTLATAISLLLRLTARKGGKHP